MADAALQELLGRGLEDFLSAESGNHQAPVSPVVTTLINILHADLWRHWGYAPTFALGHSIGAVGALESALTVMALRDGVIPPTLNYETPDPEIDLDVVAGEPRYGDYSYAINNSFGFGGHNVALAFGRY